MKTVKILTAACLLLCLTACGGNKETGQEPTTTEVEVQPSQVIEVEPEYVYRPDDTEESLDLVFSKWEEKGNKTEAKYQDVSELPNALAVPSVYGKAGDKVTTTLRVCGDVDLCAFDLNLFYDKNRLKYVGCGEVDADLMIQADEETGTIQMNFLRVVNLSDGFTFCELTFEVLTQELCESALHLDLVEAVSLDSSGEIIFCDVAVVDGMVHLNQGERDGSRMSKRKQWLIAGGILLVGAAISAWILQGTGEESDAQSEVAEGGSGYTVTFYDQNGQRLESCQVSQGEGVIPPDLTIEGVRFTGWSENLYAVERDIEVYPMGVPLGQEKNLLYADAVYADSNGPITVVPKLAGTVECSQFTIELAFDKDLLAYEGAEVLLEGLRVEEDKSRGVLIMTFRGEETLTDSSDLAELSFRCRKEGSYQTNLPMTTKEITIKEENQTRYTDSTSWDTDLYLIGCQ